MNIHAERCWHGDGQECRRLYHQMKTAFGGSFYRLAAHYKWRRKSLVIALRIGRRM
jgi:hypothetical protein